MKAKHAADIRKGITEARRRRRPHPGHIVTIYNSRYYSRLAMRAMAVYAYRHST